MRGYHEISIALFSDTTRPRIFNIFLYINPYGYSIETKFHVPQSHSFREIRDDNLKLASHCSPILFDRGSSVTQFSRKMRCYLAKIQSCTIALINNFEILQDSIALFSDTLRPRIFNIFLYINPYGYSLQTNFHVPRSHSFREKCDDNLKLASHCSHFSPILCDRGTWNLVCIHMG